MEPDRSITTTSNQAGVKHIADATTPIVTTASSKEDITATHTQHYRLRQCDQHQVYCESDLITALRTGRPEYLLRFLLSNLRSP